MKAIEIKKIMTFNLLFLTTVFLAINNSMADGVSVSRMSNGNKLSQAIIDNSVSISIESGVANNPVLLPEGETVGSSYLLFKPKAQAVLSVSDHLFLTTAFESEYKNFFDQVVADNKGEFKAQVDLGLSHFLSDHQEWGLAVSGLYNSSRSLNFTLNGPSLGGRRVEYFQSFSQLYYAINTSKLSVEFSASYIDKLNQALAQDEILTNNLFFAEFKDNFRQFDLKTKVKAHLTEDLHLLFEPFYSRRNYSERSARFSEGATNQGGNPLLEELHRGASAGFSFDDGFISLGIKGQFTKEEDLVFKAHNATSVGLQAKTKAKVASLFALSGEFSWLNRDYDFFLVNPIKDPTSRDLRRDIEKTFKIALEKNILGQDVSLFYREVDKNSNYRLGLSESSLGSVYVDKQIALNIKFNL